MKKVVQTVPQEVRDEEMLKGISPSYTDPVWWVAGAQRLFRQPGCVPHKLVYRLACSGFQICPEGSSGKRSAPKSFRSVMAESK